MYYIGIDLGGTNIAAGIVDENGKILVKDSVPTIKERPTNEIMDDTIFQQFFCILSILNHGSQIEI